MNPRERDAVTPIPPWPVLEIVLDADGGGSVNGQAVHAANKEAAQRETLTEAARYAAVLGRPLRVRALDPNGVWHLVAHPDGAVTPMPVDDVIDLRDPPEPVVEYGEADRYLAAAPEASSSDGLVLDDEVEVIGSLHLRVHPNGSITPVDDETRLSVRPRPAVQPVATPRVEPDPELRREQAPHPPAENGLPVAAFLIEEAPIKEVPIKEVPPNPVVAPVEIMVVTDGDVPSRVDVEATPLDPPEHLGAAAVERRGPSLGSARTPPLPSPRIEPSGGWTPGDGSDRIEPGTAPPAVSGPVRRPTPAPSGWYQEVAEEAEAAPRPDPQLDWARSGSGSGRQDNSSPADLIGDIRAAAPADGPRPGRTKAWIRPVAVAGAGAVLVALIAVAITSRPPGASSVSVTADASHPTVIKTAQVTSGASQGEGSTTSATHAPPTLASPPPTLAIGPPPGFGAKPVWGLPVAASATPLVSADGRIITLTVDNQIALIDPMNGRVLWHAPAPDKARGPHLIAVDGQQAVAVLTPEALTYWPLPAKPVAPTGPVHSTRVDLAAGSTVLWSGPSPLVVAADGSVGVVRNGAVQRVNLPTGAHALAADGADVLAVAGGDWIRQAAGQAPGTPLRLAAPKGATESTPIRVDNVGGSFLVGMWAGPQGPIVAVYEAHSGAIAVQSTFPKGTNFAHAVTIREAGSERTAVGTALLDPATANLSILAPTFTPVALTPGHVYADDVSGVVVDLQINGSSIKIVPFQGKNPTVPVGITTGGSHTLAIVVTPSGANWLLCALPTT